MHLYLFSPSEYSMRTSLVLFKFSYNKKAEKTCKLKRYQSKSDNPIFTSKTFVFPMLFRFISFTIKE